MKSFLWRNKIRLHKYLSKCGVASRRKSEEYIKEGRVEVNGEIITDMGFTITQGDEIKFDGNKVSPEEKVYIVLNKPAGYLCTTDDELNRETIYDIVNIKDLKLFSLGRLDKDTSGLIILTNDGDFANSIIHPSNNILKEYIVETYKKSPDKLVDNFKNGIKIDGVFYKAEKIIRIGNENVLRVFLKEGKKREIREVFNHFSARIKKLKRVAIGGLRLENINIQEGEYEYYKMDELVSLIKKID